MHWLREYKVLVYVGYMLVKCAIWLVYCSVVDLCGTCRLFECECGG